jgi:hypothetical protein
LAVLLVDVDEVSLKALIHDFRDVSKIEFHQGFEVEQLQTVIIKETLTCSRILLTLGGSRYWDTLRGLKDLSAPIEKFVTLFVIECIDHQALP